MRHKTQILQFPEDVSRGRIHDNIRPECERAGSANQLPVFVVVGVVLIHLIVVVAVRVVVVSSRRPRCSRRRPWRGAVTEMVSGKH
jgi:hypothetical protein